MLFAVTQQVPIPDSDIIVRRRHAFKQWAISVMAENPAKVRKYCIYFYTLLIVYSMKQLHNNTVAFVSNSCMTLLITISINKH